MELPTLDAGEVHVRQLALSDLADLHVVFSDERAMRYWSRPAFQSIEETGQYLAAIEEGRNRGNLLQWGIEHVESGRIIGTTTLFYLNDEQGRAEIGYILGSPWWGRGYATAALRQVLLFARDAMGLRRIEADVDPRNVASLKCIERLGFQREGLLRERWIVAGEVQDALILGLLLRDL